MNDKELEVKDLENEVEVFDVDLKKTSEIEKKEEHTVDFMDDFSQVVEETQEEHVDEKNTEIVENSNQSVPQVEDLKSVESVESPVSTPIEVKEVVQEEIPMPTESTKKKSNWPFILILFAIVGVFVALLPFLVRIFGY